MRIIKVIGIFVLVFLGNSLLGFSQNKKPNIVIIYTDDQGCGDVSALNPNAKFDTPNMDSLVKEGIAFTDGHSSDAVCTPSRYTLLTGRYSWRTSLKQGVLKADGPCLIEEDRMTIASLLKNNGYHTAMIGKWHLQMDFVGKIGEGRDWSKPFSDGPIEKGFDYFFGIAASMNYGVLTYLENNKVLEAPTLFTKKKMNVTPRTYRMTPPYSIESHKNDVEVAPSFNDELVLETITNKAVAYIDSSSTVKDGKPFFLYVPMTSPHLPHCTHPDFQGKSACGNYGDFMQETDFRVGQILNALKENNLDNNTLVIFSSDNGAESNYEYQRDTYQHFSSLNFKGGKRDIYEGGHRVPFLMRWPSVIEAGRKVDTPVCQSDYLATIAEIINVKLPSNAGEDSYSLYSILKGETDKLIEERAVIHHSAMGYLAIRQGKWKLNMVRGSGGSLKPRLILPKGDEPIFELYNLDEDPGEEINLYKQYPKIVNSLTKEITKIIKKGRSTKGSCQPYVKDNWGQLTWMSVE